MNDYAYGRCIGTALTQRRSRHSTDTVSQFHAETPHATELRVKDLPKVATWRLERNRPYTATSGPIILFLFKIYHFRTYFLYTIRYNISRPVQDPTTPVRPPTTPLPKIWGSRSPTPRTDVPALL